VEKVALRDVVMEPPSLAFGKKRTSASSSSTAKSKADRAIELGADRSKVRAKELPVSLKQQQEMQAERERAVNMWAWTVLACTDRSTRRGYMLVMNRADFLPCGQFNCRYRDLKARQAAAKEPQQ
jgi:hypothetical protein